MATASSRKSYAAGESILYFLVVVGILVVANVLGIFGIFARSDWTGADLFTLSEGSRRLAREIDDRMEIRAYFTEDMPNPEVERYARDILTEYEEASNGNIRLTIINPDEEAEKEAAEEDGLTRMQLPDYSEDEFSVREGYRGIVIEFLGEKRTIDILDTSGLEYQITTLIKEMSGEKRRVAVMGGHGSPTLTKGIANLRSWLPTYELEEVNADERIRFRRPDARGDSPGYSALLIVNPTEAFTEAELRVIDRFVMDGGSLGIFGGAANINLQGADPQAEMVDTGLNRLISRWGVRLKRGMVLDLSCIPVPMQSPIPGLQIRVPYPALPLVQFNEAQQEHPIAFRIPSAVVPFPARVERMGTAPEGIDRQVVAQSSEQSWFVSEDSLPLRPRQRIGEWPPPPTDSEGEIETGPYPLVVSIQGRLPSAFAAGGEGAMSEEPDKAGEKAAPARTQSAGDVRVLVAGTGFFLVDEFLPPNSEQGAVNRNSAAAFAFNAIDWLAQDSDLVEIRAKTVEDPVLAVPAGVRQAETEARSAHERAEQAEDEETQSAAIQERDAAMERLRDESEVWDRKKAGFQWGNTFGIPVLVVIFGLIRWRMRVSRKRKLTL